MGSEKPSSNMHRPPRHPQQQHLGALRSSSATMNSPHSTTTSANNNHHSDNHHSDITNAKSFAKRECSCAVLASPSPDGANQSGPHQFAFRKLSLASSKIHPLNNLDPGCIPKDSNGEFRQHKEDGEPGAGPCCLVTENDENCCPRGSHRWNLDSLSFAKHCEMRLESLLNVPSSNNDKLPDVQRTKACFQVLEELCQNKLPFSSFLDHICSQLKRCLYQNAKCEASFSEQKGGTYFELADELRQDISEMETSNSSWKSRLLDEEKDLQRIRAELMDLREEIIEADKTSNELEENISTAMRVLSLEEKKVNGLHQKIKSLNQELKDIRHEVKQTQQLDTMKDVEIQEYKKLKAHYMQCVHEFQHVQGFVRACQSEISNSVPKADVIAAKAEELELSDKINEVKGRVEAFIAATRQLTPRPKWGGEMPGMDKPPGVSTSEQVECICKENAFLASSISRFQLGFAASEAILAEIKEQAMSKVKSSSIGKARGNADATKSKEKKGEIAGAKASTTRAKSQEKQKKKKKKKKA